MKNRKFCLINANFVAVHPHTGNYAAIEIIYRLDMLHPRGNTQRRIERICTGQACRRRNGNARERDIAEHIHISDNMTCASPSGKRM